MKKEFTETVSVVDRPEIVVFWDGTPIICDVKPEKEKHVQFKELKTVYTVTECNAIIFLKEYEVKGVYDSFLKAQEKIKELAIQYISTLEEEDKTEYCKKLLNEFDDKRLVFLYTSWNISKFTLE